jgi:hypothetical protein
MPHRVAHGIALRIQHCFLRLYNHVYFHASHANAELFGNKR